MKHKTRKEKIRLLKDLDAGRISVNDLKEPGYDIWIEKNGAYWPAANPDLILTRQAYEAYRAQNSHLKGIEVNIILPDNGRDSTQEQAAKVEEVYKRNAALFHGGKGVSIAELPDDDARLLWNVITSKRKINEQL